MADSAHKPFPPRSVPGSEGSQGPFESDFGKPHVYARDPHSGAGNCVCGASLGHADHTEAAPGLPVPAWARTKSREKPSGK